jgi:hypothetical protein
MWDRENVYRDAAMQSFSGSANSAILPQEVGWLNNRSSWMNRLAVQLFILAAVRTSKKMLTVTSVSLSGPDAMLFYNRSGPGSRVREPRKNWGDKSVRAIECA